MSSIKPSAPKGMRDFGPVEMARRSYIFNTIAAIYRKYGFSPIETPAMEKLDTLTGKYGEEGDRLIFKVLNSGDYLKAVHELPDAATSWNSKSMLKHISEKALRYDLTVPFARFVVQYHHQLTFPFKRYQIQPVWRADNPQKGRYREFYQCDADVVGSDSLLNEIEFVAIFNEVLNALQLHDFVIKMNNRKVLAGIAEVINLQGPITQLTVALDKLDKIGKEKVLEELAQQGLHDIQRNQVAQIIDFRGDGDERIAFLRTFLERSEIGQKGLDELEKVIQTGRSLGIQHGIIDFDMTLARGLDYYTGCIFEVKINNSGMGSIAGGGRYDDLTGIFGMSGLSGVGISFGADRIYDILLARNLYPDFNQDKIKYLFLNFGEQEALASLEIVHALRQKQIHASLYPDAAKLKKQMGYADSIGALNVCMLGSEELQNNTIAIKNLQTGTQTRMSLPEFLQQA